jgi:hypothetical protein
MSQRSGFILTLRASLVSDQRLLTQKLDGVMLKEWHLRPKFRSGYGEHFRSLAEALRTNR